MLVFDHATSKHCQNSPAVSASDAFWNTPLPFLDQIMTLLEGYDQTLSVGDIPEEKTDKGSSVFDGK